MNPVLNPSTLIPVESWKFISEAITWYVASVTTHTDTRRSLSTYSEHVYKDGFYVETSAIIN